MHKLFDGLKRFIKQVINHLITEPLNESLDDLQIYIMWTVDAFFTAIYLAGWTFIQHQLNLFITPFKLTIVDTLVLTALQFFFAVSTLSPVGVYVFQKIRNELEKARTEIRGVKSTTRLIPDYIEHLFKRGQFWVVDENGTTWIDVQNSFAMPNLSNLLVKRTSNKDRSENILDVFSRVNEKLDLTVTAFSEENHELCKLHIRAILTDKWPKKSDTKVEILQDKRMFSSYTDEKGEVVFSHFPVTDLDRIVLRIPL